MDLKIGHLTAPSSVNKAQTNGPKPRGIIIYRARTPDGGGSLAPIEPPYVPPRRGGRSAAQRTNGTGLDAPSVWIDSSTRCESTFNWLSFPFTGIID
jgi:hypothetical protein